MRILAFVSLLVYAVVGRSQILDERVLSPIYASASDEVKCLFFDHSGMMWIGTNSGLKSYDGYTLKSYSSNVNTPGLFPNNSIMCLTEDKQDRLWIGTRDGILRMDRRTGERRIYHLPLPTQRIIDVLFTSADGTVWIGTDECLFSYDPKQDDFVAYDAANTWIKDLEKPRTRIGAYCVKSIAEDKDGFLYVGTWKDGLMRFDRRRHTMYRYAPLNKRNNAYSVFVDSRQRLWIGTWGSGLLRMDRPADIAHPGLHDYYRQTSDFNNYYKITEDPVSKAIWACSREGVSIIGIDDTDQELRNYTFAGVQKPQPLDFTCDIATDGKGNLWIATLYHGILQLNTNKSHFRLFPISRADMPVRINSVCNLYTEDGQHVWICTKAFGLALYDCASGKAHFVQHMTTFQGLPKLVKESTFSSIVKRFNGDLWFANNYYGIVVLRGQQPAQLYDSSKWPFIKDNRIKSLCQTHDSAMWVGSVRRTSVVYPDDSGRALTMREDGRDFTNADVNNIIEDKKHHVWIATANEGIIRVSGAASRSSRLVFHQYKSSLGNYALEDANTCFEDSHGRLWAISINGGLFRYVAQKDRFEPVNRTYHIDGDKVFSINEDARGNLWMTTDRALVRLRINDDGSSNITAYTPDDGIGDILFQPNATFRHGRELLFGSREGFFAFHPDELTRQSSVTPHFIVTDIQIDDQSYHEWDEKLRAKAIDAVPIFARSLVIPSSAKKFSVEYALLAYGYQDKCNYAYRLKGYDSAWHFQESTERQVTFQNLPPGTYTLELKAQGSNGLWHDLGYGLKIRVLPPWWATWWAWLMYALALAGMVWLAAMLYRRHMRTQNRLQMGTLFTNLTHDLLTPLSVISASIDDLNTRAPQFSSNYALVRSNVDRISHLLRQILEVRKSQAHQLKLLVSQGDMAAFVRKRCDDIRPLFVKKRIALFVDIDKHFPPTAWFDADKLDKILYNLLSNAVKYTEEGGSARLSMRSDGKKVRIRVADSGIGISQKKQKQLYERFMDGNYRMMGEIGTGLGLSLVRDLIRLSHGNIHCLSREGVGTLFTVTLPITEQAFAENEIDKTNSMKVRDEKQTELISLKIENGDSSSDDRSFLEATSKRTQAEPARSPSSESKLRKSSEREQPIEHTILLVEDNEELLAMMHQLLSRRYRVLTAKNGRQAMNLIWKEKLDLVVSDVMMPVMDGLELTHEIKSNANFAQLPVILLTAMGKDEDKNSGFASGADDYLTKPFDMNSLQLRIDNLIRSRKLIKEKLNRQLELQIDSTHNSDPEALFIQNATECVLKHITDAKYDREDFARDMCVSSSTLYNKLRAITGKNVTAFVTSVRLKEACNILRMHPDISITELSLQVGFNTPKYFARCFKKEYGLSVREFVKMKNEN